jgi:hypothetical protein
MATRVLARPFAVVAFASTLLLAATPAWAAGHTKPHGGGGGGTGGTSTTGIDVSYPQCPGTSLPSGEAFAIVGLNNGLANNYNSCLGTEFAYAQKSTAVTKQAPAQLYVNTGDPGNGVADWPSPSQLGAFNNTVTPVGTCAFASGTSGAGANSPACAYIYGYDMVAGIRYGTSGNVIGDVAAFTNATGARLTNFPVWLDVETGNSWQPGSTTGGLAMNVADLQGMVDALNAAAQGATGSNAKQIGVYSTAYQWNQITGTPTGAAAGNLGGLPDWIPGATSQSGAVSNCSQSAFTAGAVTVTQWTGSLDGDYSCIG